jgi:hypothetical protein
VPSDRQSWKPSAAEPVVQKKMPPASPRGRECDEQSPGHASASISVPAPVPSVTHSSSPELVSQAAKKTLSPIVCSHAGDELRAPRSPVGLMSRTRVAGWAASGAAANVKTRIKAFSSTFSLAALRHPLSNSLTASLHEPSTGSFIEQGV